MHGGGVFIGVALVKLVQEPDEVEVGGGFAQFFAEFNECLEALPAFAGLGAFGFLWSEADGGEGRFNEFVYAGADEVGWLVCFQL